MKQGQKYRIWIRQDMDIVKQQILERQGCENTGNKTLGMSIHVSIYKIHQNCNDLKISYYKNKEK